MLDFSFNALSKLRISGKQFENIATVVLRLPGLFICDYWWQFSLNYSIPKSLDWPDVASACLTNLVVLQAFVLLILPLESLVTVYMHYVSAAVITAADLFSRHYVLTEQEEVLTATVQVDVWTLLQVDSEHAFLKRQLAAIGVHLLVATSVSFMLDVEGNAKRAALAAYSVPVASRLANFPVVDLNVVHNCSSAFIILISIYYILSVIPRLFAHLRRTYSRTAYDIDYYGGFYVFGEVSSRVLSPVLHITFWIVLLAIQTYAYFMRPELKVDEWYLIVLYVLSEICCSPLTLWATCIAICYASRLVLRLTKLYIQAGGIRVHDPLIHAGVGEGVTAALLAVQTGLTTLKMPHRMGAMSIVLFVVVGSLIASMYEITEPVLLALAASHSKSIGRHLRLLTLCIFLFAFPLYMIYMLYHVFDLDFWTLVVISTCALTSVQVLGLIFIYGLFTYDASSEEPWDSLDDVVYYARASTRLLEFLVAVFVVGAGVWESLQEEWSWINTLVLVVHCYYNVWERLQAGWKSFLQRREAVRKMQSLPTATREQLTEYQDVCAICYSDMIQARITPCKHYFHGTCLRKWLYIQDRCPLCFTKIAIES